MKSTSIVVIGGGQSGLATGYFLQKANASFVILDDQPAAGGAWRHGWESLQLFSPAENSSLPGWLMPKSQNAYPSRQEVIDYLENYEKRYRLPVVRPVNVTKVMQHENGYLVETSAGKWHCRAVISATGSWRHPFIPGYPGRELFRGKQLHSAFYQNPDELAGKQVMVVGGGNSAAQILAEVSKVAATTWVTMEPPRFLPDEVDGRYLFDFATRQYRDKLAGKPSQSLTSLGDIVMVESVKEARSRNVLVAKPVFSSFDSDGVRWENGARQPADAIIWCTGFRAALGHLEALGIVEADGKVVLHHNQAVKSPGLWLVGYGHWTGFASATLIGVGRTAKEVATAAVGYVSVP